MSNPSTSLWARRVRHVASPTLFWASVLLIVATVVVLWPSHADEARIRWWGMALQIVGIWSVVSELRARGEDIGAPTLLEAGRQFLARMPGKGVTLSAGTAEMMMVGGTVRATQRAGPPGPDALVEDRLAAVERNIKFIDDDLGKVEFGLDAERRARATSVRDEKDERVQAIDSMKNAIKQATAKTLPFSMVGVVWLLLGVILSCTSIELERWLHLLHP